MWLTGSYLVFVDLYRLCGDPTRETEAFQRHLNFSQMLLKDHFQASQMPEHGLLIQWTHGPFPSFSADSSASTSGALI